MALLQLVCTSSVCKATVFLCAIWELMSDFMSCFVFFFVACFHVWMCGYLQKVAGLIQFRSICLPVNTS